MRIPTTAFQNLAAGLRLLAFLPVERKSFHASLRQVVLFGALAGGIWFVFDRLMVGGHPQFVWAAVGQVCWLAVVFAGALLLLSPAGRDPETAALVLTATASILPGYLLIVLVAVFLSDNTPFERWMVYFVVSLGALYLYRIARLVNGSTVLASLAAALVVCGITWAAFHESVMARPQLWRARDDAGADSVGAEELMFRQAPLIDAAVRELAPQTDGKTDVYFVGFAGDGRQSVFGSEVAYARQVLEQKLNIEQRAIELVNAPVTSEATPIATGTGLRFALARIASVMDVDNDVLVLFLTSHGTRDSGLVINRPGVALRDLSAADLAGALADSGIQWRIVIISACYSGSFIDALRDEQSLVITAARADRKSFGCRDDRELTYFGEALFRDAMPQSGSLLEAVTRAEGLISAREQAEDFTPSEPQSFVGARMQSKLDEIIFRTREVNRRTAD
jgi:hypothetical protein